MKTMKRAAFAALLVLVPLAGCIGRVRRPEVTLAGVKLGGLGLRGGTVVAQLNIDNPNGFDIETAQITYDFKVSDPNVTTETKWIDFAKGTFTEKIKVDSHKKTPIEIPIEFTYAAVGGAIRSIMDRGTFNYRVEGTVTLREPMRTEVPYRHSGNVSLQGIR